MTDNLTKRSGGYQRVMLKLGGEMFGGGSVGIDPDVVSNVARQIASVARDGVQVAVVIDNDRLAQLRLVVAIVQDTFHVF